MVGSTVTSRQAWCWNSCWEFTYFPQGKGSKEGYLRISWTFKNSKEHTSSTRPHFLNLLTQFQQRIQIYETMEIIVFKIPHSTTWPTYVMATSYCKNTFSLSNFKSPNSFSQSQQSLKVQSPFWDSRLLIVTTCKKQKANYILPTYNDTKYMLPVHKGGKGA